MNLSRFAHLPLLAVLIAALGLLGCEAASTSAGVQAPPVYPASAAEPLPELVTVTSPAVPTNAPAGVMAEEEIAPPTPPMDPEDLPSELQEVVKLAQSGVGDDVILAFIQNAPKPFNLTPEQIVFLTDIGLSDVIITALVNHRGTLAEAPAQVQPAPPPTAAPQVAAGQEALPPVTYNPEPQVVYSEPPVVQYVSPPPVVEYNYFYSSLAPYGVWVDIPSYGRCWQPTVALRYRDWRPYSDRGRWLYTDHGYYWHSDYSWGWAPFHYGRWFNHPRRGWCWTPGSVWAPAWVSWRYTDTHCGWAPLPPGSHYRPGFGFTYYGANVGLSFGFGLRYDAWTFVSGHHFHDRDVWRHRVARSEHHSLYRRSKVVNNYVINNNTIINKGIDDGRVRGLRRDEPRRVAIRDLPQGRGMRPDRLQQEGSDLVVYRPRPLAPQPSFRTLEANDSRTIRSQPSGAAVGVPNSFVGRRNEPSKPVTLPAPRSEPAPGTIGSSRPIRALGSESTRPSTSASVPGATVPSRNEPRPGLPVRTLPGATVAQPQPTSRPSSQGSISTGIPNRNEPARSWSVPSTQRGITPAPPQSVGQPVSATRQEPAGPVATRPQPVTPRSAAPQTFQVPAPASNPSWNQLNNTPSTRPAPQSVPSTPPARRQEIPKPASSIAAEKYTYRAPAPVAQPRAVPSFQGAPAQNSGPGFGSSQPSRPAPSWAPSPAPAQSRPVRSYSGPSYTPPSVQSRPAPTYSAPSVQSRPAPTYRPPAVQSRPAPSYSPPAVQSRPSQPATSFFTPAPRSAPQSAPAPSQTSRQRRD